VCTPYCHCNFTTWCGWGEKRDLSDNVRTVLYVIHSELSRAQSSGQNDKWPTFMAIIKPSGYTVLTLNLC
jgi:hypothetical protein